MTAGCCAQRHWAQSPSLFIHCGAERRAETYPRSTRSNRRGNGDALTSSLRFSRAREKRGTSRAGRRFLFAKFLFAKLRLGANAGGMDFERSARTLLRSAARCAETHPRSALVGRTGRAELRGRCSMTAGCCAQRHWAQSPSLFIHCGAERRAETYPRSTRSDRRGNGDALTSSLRFSRAREKRGTGRAGRRTSATEKTRRLLTNRPCLGFVDEEPAFQKDVYASAIGLCKDSTIMQSTKPSNSDFWRSFNM